VGNGDMMIGFVSGGMGDFIKHPLGCRNACMPDGNDAGTFDFTLNVYEATPDTAETTDAASWYKTRAVGTYDVPTLLWMAVYKSGNDDANAYRPRNVFPEFLTTPELIAEYEPTHCGRGPWKMKIEVDSDNSASITGGVSLYLFQWDGSVYFTGLGDGVLNDGPTKNITIDGSTSAVFSASTPNCLPFVPLIHVELLFGESDFTYINCRFRGYRFGETPNF
jgi:hypothetical protein